MRMKNMNEKKEKKYDWCTSYTCVPLCSHLIDILGAQTLFLEEDDKNTEIEIPDFQLFKISKF